MFWYEDKMILLLDWRHPDKFYNNNYLTICLSSSWNHLELSYRSNRLEVFCPKCFRSQRYGYIENRLHCRCFPVNFADFLGKTILQDICELLLLVLPLVTSTSSFKFQDWNYLKFKTFSRYFLKLHNHWWICWCYWNIFNTAYFW